MLSLGQHHLPSAFLLRVLNGTGSASQRLLAQRSCALRASHPAQQVSRRCLASAAASARKLKRSTATTAEVIDLTQQQQDDTSSIKPGIKQNLSAAQTHAALSYQKMTQREHILHRPEPYIGSMQHDTRDMWLLTSNKKAVVQRPQFEVRSVQYAPALVHIFDEIIVNAADNRHRNSTGSGSKASTKMTRIEVDIDTATGQLRVLNDGAGIPLLHHPRYNIYIPTLIFGELLTSSNYDDQQQRYTGGRHGYGAKLSNIFSKQFMVECVDHVHQLRFQQVWRDNMSVKSDAVVQPTADATSSSTCITFTPDYQLFGETRLTQDTYSLMVRRIIDIAAVVADSGITVTLNGTEVGIHKFEDYVKCFVEQTAASRSASAHVASDSDAQSTNIMPYVFTQYGKNWQIAVAPTLSTAADNASAKDLSFVNAIATTRGGTHVNFVAEKVATAIAAHLHKQHKLTISTNTIKQYFSLFITTNVSNPSFSSQTKEQLITPVKDFSGDLPANLPKAFIEQVIQHTSIVPTIVDQQEARQQHELSKKLKQGSKSSTRSMLHIEKLDDANYAGSAQHARDCTLIVTEGDSAKALVLAGMSVIGRDKYGVFPLRGKLLNVRDASALQIAGNTEIKHLIQILGLKPGKVYDSDEAMKTLRYGKLMLMTDQDHDGSHIKGLLINLFHRMWPSLLERNDFMSEFITAVIKATPPASVDRQRKPLQFHTLPEYIKWRESLSEHEVNQYSIKYYKGLGTSTAAEGKEYFRALNNHQIKFLYEGSTSDTAIELAFSKLAVNDRKIWLSQPLTDVYVDHNQKQLSYTDFIHKELILFSNADNIRSIPSLVDGLKPVQRKILYACFKRRLTSDIKVAQLAGYIAEITGYHHGEVSLHGAIVNMAQDFVGSNNLNLLVPSGQFGTRHMGGKDSASARYIFTRLATVARLIFRPEDDTLLEHVDEDGIKAEPKTFLPVIPLLLVNGSQGIGTGFSTFVPTYNPLDIIQNIRNKLNNQPVQQMTPYAHGHRGKITPHASNSAYVSEGVAEVVTPTQIDITELPINVWTQDYKKTLQSLTEGNGSNSIAVRRVQEYHTNDTVHFKLTMAASEVQIVQQAGLLQTLRLTNTLSTNNLHAFDPQTKIKRYNAAEEMLEEYYHVRLQAYHQRKAHQLSELQTQERRASNRMRFIAEVLSGAIKLNNKTKATLRSQLHDAGYVPVSQLQLSTQPSEQQQLANDAYDYLVDMPLSSLTSERVKALQHDVDEMKQKVQSLQQKSAEELWQSDLDELEAHIIKSHAAAEKTRKADL